MANRRFNDQQERNIALSYLCAVDPETPYFQRRWNIKEVTIRCIILGDRSKD